ncbi:FadR family transcriptional regulator [Motiliproteus coralliicola]|uniref:FadR family transcriptional regulator n=1 Tax=Motiliproteus coralliicola TaxID=2283196 RepID=A0A369WDX1_9GAMM|nr:FadR/GntR family transcriptional regulator [Motiliproteus coralliicola]RDE18816.1 FadR family transcriptional regulator [Motiliproteus coralliicola]
MAIRFNNLVTQSLAKQIAEQIRSAILEGRLRVDERLPTEEELAARFEVSRPTIREALKRLAAQNLVRSKRGPAGGTFITRPTESELRTTLANSTTLMVTLGEFDIESITEARREMEGACLKLAIERRTEQHLEQLDQELAYQQQSISDEEFCASDVRFHRLIIDATANPVMQFNMVTVIEALQPLMNMIANRTRSRDRIIQHHKQLLDAIQRQDLVEAQSSLNQLLDYLLEHYRQAQQLRSTSSQG